MSSIADRVRIAQDKDGMLRRALERIIQLYTDRSHFVYELLQNAEDAQAKCVKFVQYPDRLEVMHDGKPFTAENLQGLCDIGKSDKVDDLNQIGEFGVGFKSVFGICDTVRLYSEPANFRKKDVGTAIPFAVEIVDFTSPRDIAPIELEHAFTTKFIFPYTVGRSFSGFKTIPELNAVLAKKLQNLGITTLLFMKNLELIEYQIKLDDKTVEGQYLLEKQQINDHCSLVSALGLSDAPRSKEGVSEEISYLMFSRHCHQMPQRTVDIAFPVVVKPDGTYECQKPKDPYISVYFPTETESKLGFIVQGPYRTTPNRSSIPADEEKNIQLAKETAILLSDTLLEMRDAGTLNMSFVKALPLSARSFEAYGLFEPLYETVKNLFTREAVIPCKNGGYVSSRCAKIARQERLATLFSDKLLTQLIQDGSNYRWLPTYLTETNKEYEPVYKYLNGELKIGVVRPEDLRAYFAANPAFLPKQSDDWLVELYSILENVGAAFAKTRNEANMLTADIIKTSTGKFVAAYRRSESKQYIPNVFLPTDKIHSSDINFVDPVIYERCQHFFDNILQLKKPDEYEFFIKDIKKRYEGAYVFDADQHAEDVRKLYKYLKLDDYKDEVTSVIKDCFVVKCTDGKMHNCFMQRVFLPLTQSGINIEGYFVNIAKNVFYVDMDYYTTHNISVEVLCAVGVHDSILYGENVVQGQYSTGNPGKQPEWWTSGSFRWKLTIDSLKDAVKYISAHPRAKDAIIKSKTIMAVLFENESRLCGFLHIGGSTPNRENEPCEMIRILSGGFYGWDGKWIFTESAELVAPKAISKHDISVSIYGKVRPDSAVYELLGFRKTEADEVDSIKKTMTPTQLDALFENLLKQRYGVSSDDLTAHFGGSVWQGEGSDTDTDDEFDFTFPVGRVKNWETLKKHAAEMLVFADPVKYDYAVRRIRVSNKPKEARAYLLNMYRYDGVYKYACQMCHDACSNIEVVQLFNNPDFELDPLNLCLCPNCAALYRQIRKNTAVMDALRQRIVRLSESDVTGGEHVALDVDNEEIWFTQTHMAEIQALLQLSDAVSSGKKEDPVITQDDEDDKGGLSVYSTYVGKRVKRKIDGFVGEVVKVDSDFLYIKVITPSKRGSGPAAGEETKVQLSFVIGNSGVYEIV